MKLVGTLSMLCLKTYLASSMSSLCTLFILHISTGNCYTTCSAGAIKMKERYKNWNDYLEFLFVEVMIPWLGKINKKHK